MQLSGSKIAESIRPRGSEHSRRESIGLRISLPDSLATRVTPPLPETCDPLLDGQTTPGLVVAGFRTDR
jgi:hypothetical protein